MRRNIYSDFVDSYSLKKFVEKIFPVSSVVCTNMDVAVDIEEAVESLDVTKECLETLLCYLELSGKVRLKGVVKDACTVKCYGGGQQVKQLSWKVPAMAAAVATLTRKGKTGSLIRVISYRILSRLKYLKFHTLLCQAHYYNVDSLPELQSYFRAT